MKNSRSIFKPVLIAVVLFVLVSPAVNADIVDRIIATVNTEPILNSDVLWQIALSSRIPLTNIPVETKEDTLNNIIDARLIHQEASRLPTASVSDKEIDDRLRNIIATFPSPMVFQQRIESIGLTSAALRDVLRGQIEVEKYIDFRFRSFVVVSEDEIKNQYETEEAAKAKAQGIVQQPLSDPKVRKMVEDIVREQKINNQMETWLTDARKRADIVRLAQF